MDMIPNDNSPKNWTEDYQHENGKYICHCVKCDEYFFGYKRRVVCKECATLSHPTLPSDEEIQDNAERVPNLNFDEEEGYILGAKWMRSICQAKLAEVEKEIESLKDDIDVLKARLLLND